MSSSSSAPTDSASTPHSSALSAEPAIGVEPATAVTAHALDPLAEPVADATGTAAAASAVSAVSAADASVQNAAPTAAPVLPPIDCAQELRQRFPRLFSGPPKPLKLRIQADIQERAPGVFTKQALSVFFRRYTGSTSYLTAASRATHRFDLDGAPSTDMLPEHRQVAAEELARRRGNQEARQALEEQQRRNRAGLLRDFSMTTLTPANFCALKGVAVEELDGLLARAREEAAQANARPERTDGPHRNDRNDRNDRPDRGRPQDTQPRSRPPADTHRPSGPAGSSDDRQRRAAPRAPGDSRR